MDKRVTLKKMGHTWKKAHYENKSQKEIGAHVAKWVTLKKRLHLEK